MSLRTFAAPFTTILLERSQQNAALYSYHTSMMNPTIVSAIEYDVLALQLAEAEMLRAELEEFGPARLRRAFKERGGAWTTVWIVLTFVGLEYAKSIITKLAEGHVARLHKKIQRVFKTDDGKLLLQQSFRVSLSFDDVDISVNLPRDSCVFRSIRPPNPVQFGQAF
ncbi:MAG: hypothetical protein ABJB74_08470, partial [Gemmatimonas sp.]